MMKGEGGREGGGGRERGAIRYACLQASADDLR